MKLWKAQEQDELQGLQYQPFLCLLDEDEVELHIKSDQDQVICLDRHQTEE